MTFRLHPFKDIRQSFEQIGHAVSASAAFTRAAKDRQAALARQQSQSSGPASLF